MEYFNFFTNLILSIIDLTASNHDMGNILESQFFINLATKTRYVRGKKIDSRNKAPKQSDMRRARTELADMITPPVMDVKMLLIWK